jgi:hypothetical protein
MKRATAEITPLPPGSESVHNFSRFFGQRMYLVDNTKFWETWEPINIPPSPTDFYVTVNQAVEGRLDLLSYRYYNTPELWWVLAEVNGIFFPPDDLKIGMVLRIPSFTSIASLGLVR